MFERCIYFNLATLNRQITRIWDEAFVRLGLSSSHGYLLSAMAANPKASQKQLSEWLKLDASTISRHVDALTVKGLIEKQSSGKGARFALTKKCRSVSREIDELMDHLFGQMNSVLGKNELQEFVNSLQCFRQQLTEQ